MKVAYHNGEKTVFLERHDLVTFIWDGEPKNVLRGELVSWDRVDGEVIVSIGGEFREYPSNKFLLVGVQDGEATETISSNDSFNIGLVKSYQYERGYT